MCLSWTLAKSCLKPDLGKLVDFFTRIYIFNLHHEPHFLFYITYLNFHQYFQGFWKLNGTTLMDKLGIWKSTFNWELPSQNSSGIIRNIDTNMVLVVINDSKDNQTKVVEKLLEDSNANNTIWKMGEVDNKGYFTIINLAYEKVLIPVGANNLTMESKYLLTYLLFCT